MQAIKLQKLEISCSLPRRVIIYYPILTGNMSKEREEQALYYDSFQILEKSSVLGTEADLMGFRDFSPKFQKISEKSLIIF